MKIIRQLVIVPFVLLLIILPGFGFGYDSGEILGNEVIPLIKGSDIFNQINDMILNAKKAIHIEMYSFGQTQIADKLIAKKREGLEVQVILDRSSVNIGNYLEKGGIDVRYYRQPRRYIDHVKLLNVDGNLSLMGGMNWGTHSPLNHDADILIKGPAANDLNSIFAQDWIFNGGTSSYKTSTPLSVSGHNSITNVTTFHHGKTTKSDIKTYVLHFIKNATSTIYLELFVMTDLDVIQALIDAHNRGVDVRVLFDPKQKPNQNAYETLKKNGIKVLYYPVKPGQKFHIKMGVADSSKTIIGSCNWSKKGFYGNHELDSYVVGKETAASFETMFKRDWIYAKRAWSSGDEDHETCNLAKWFISHFFCIQLA